MFKAVKKLVDTVNTISKQNSAIEPQNKSESYLEMERSFAEFSKKADSKFAQASTSTKNIQR